MTLCELEQDLTVDANLNAGRMRRILVGARIVVRLTPSLYDASRRIGPYPRPVAIRLLFLSETQYMSRFSSRGRKVSLEIETLEAREVPAGQPVWGGFAHDPQHSDISTVASQALETIHWSTPVDLAPQSSSGGDLLIHYGSPLVTANNTVLVPVKTSANGNFRVEAHNGETGQLLWQAATDYTTPASSWTPSFSPVLTPQGRLYLPGAGGTIYYIDNPDSASRPQVNQLAFYGLSTYAAAPATFNRFVQISTPITSDSAGDIYFGFIVTGNTGAGLQSGLARISASGQGTWVAATTMANDAHVVSIQYNSAPALSNDERTLYVAVNQGDSSGYLLALDSTTLAQRARGRLFDPKSGLVAKLLNISTASPVVGPDGDVYIGVNENPFPENNDRGWLLHFSGDLSQTKTPGAFGWDDTPSIVPASMVPSYHGSSAYLLMAKYNNYGGIGTGNGQNRIAILDPNSETEVDPVTGVTVMNPALSILGQTPDSEHPGGVREWCINAAAVDPATGCVLVNSEDGTLYRWNLSTNTFTQQMHLAPPTGEAYTPTIIGGDGTVYAINDATLWAVASNAPPAITSQAYVANVYQLLLGRIPDSSSSVWVNDLDSGASPASVVRGIEGSTEYLSDQVVAMYKLYLQRSPDTGGEQAWTNFLLAGGTLEQVAEKLASSPEYFILQGGTNQGFITGLYRDVLNRAPSIAELAGWETALGARVSRARVSDDFLTSREYRSNLVQADYMTFLLRPADQGGLMAWVNALNAGATDLLAGIFGSPEGFQLWS